MYRAAEMVCAVAACGLIAWAGYTAFRPPGGSDETVGEPAERPMDAGEPGLVVENAVQDLGELPVGEHPVVFRVANRTDRPGEIVGGASGCNPICCFYAQDRGRIPVPPGGAAELVSRVAVHSTGPFEYEGPL